MEHQDELDQIMKIVKQSFDAQAESWFRDVKKGILLKKKADKITVCSGTAAYVTYIFSISNQKDREDSNV